MKWLIFSTIGKNPGDEFIRVGTEYLINKVDSDAIIEILDKETDDVYNNTDFDKCIWAGMPVFWSLNSNNNWEIGWWKHLTGVWPSQNKNNFCVLGAGSFQDWENIERGANLQGLEKSAMMLKQNSFVVTVRDPIVNKICKSNFDVLVCPAIFACKDKVKSSSIKACNMMPGGAHYREFNKRQASVWDSIQQPIASILLQNNFIFFAHNSSEYNFAKKLGWSDNSIVNYETRTEYMLENYRNVDKFFGNRVHGCIVSRSNGADVISCGYDSRQEAVKLSGAKTLLPSEINLNKFASWAESDSKYSDPQLDVIEQSYIQLLEKFIKSKSI